jgi:hypothetical protein
LTRTHQQLSLEIIYEVTNSTLTLGASLSLVASGFSDSNAVPNFDSYAGEHRQRCPAPGGDDHIGGRKPTCGGWGVIRPAAGEVQFPDVGPDARIVMSLGTVLALRGGGDRPGHPECPEEHWDRSLDRQPPFEMVEAPGVALRAR